MIEIKTEKVVERGVQKRKIISISALTEEELPLEYTREGIRVLFRPDSYTGGFLRIENTCENVPVGHVFSETYFLQRFLPVIKEASQRLRDINKKLAEANKDWHGEETFLI